MYNLIDTFNGYCALADLQGNSASFTFKKKVTGSTGNDFTKKMLK